MSLATESASAGMEYSGQGIEGAGETPFLPTPPEVARIIGRDIADVHEMYESAVRREELVQHIMEQQEQIVAEFGVVDEDEVRALVEETGRALEEADGEPGSRQYQLEQLEQRLILARQTLASEHDFLNRVNPAAEFENEQEAAQDALLDRIAEREESAESGEDRGFWGAAWDKLASLPKKHPIITTLLVVAGTAAAIAGGFYLAGELEWLLAKIGLAAQAGATKVPEAVSYTHLTLPTT